MKKLFSVDFSFDAPITPTIMGIRGYMQGVIEVTTPPIKTAMYEMMEMSARYAEILFSNEAPSEKILVRIELLLFQLLAPSFSFEFLFLFYFELLFSAHR